MARTLNDTARTILAAAAARDDLRALPLPDTLRAPPHIVKKTVTTLIEAGLLAEITALPDDAIWTEGDADERIALVATPAGLAAIGIDTEAAAADAPPPQPRTGGKGRGRGHKPATRAKAAPRAATGAAGAKGTKQNEVIALLRRQQGASVPEMVEATGWQPHSVRGFMSGALKKRLGLEVVSEKAEGAERRYHVAALRAAND